MPTKSQHAARYRPLPVLLRQRRQEARLTQRQLGDRLGRPQSWIYTCETANRRVDVAEFVEWAGACGVKPVTALRRFMAASEG